MQASHSGHLTCGSYWTPDADWTVELFIAVLTILTELFRPVQLQLPALPLNTLHAYYLWPFKTGAALASLHAAVLDKCNTNRPHFVDKKPHYVLKTGHHFSVLNRTLLQSTPTHAHSISETSILILSSHLPIYFLGPSFFIFWTKIL